MHEHVVVDFLVRVRRVVHEHKVARIACHKKVAHAVDGTLVQAPAHIGGSRLGQVRLGFHEEVVTQVDERDDFRLHLAALLVGPDLHDARTAEHEDGPGIRVVRTAMRTFKGVNQDCRTELGNNGVADFAADRVLIGIGHLGPGRIGDVAEVGAGPTITLGLFGAGGAPGIGLAAATKVVGIREERIAVLVPDKRSEFLLLQAVRSLGDEFHPVALVREVLLFGMVLVNLGRKPVEVAGDTRRPEPFLVRVHHQVPEAFRAGSRSRGLHHAPAAIGSFLLRGLAYLVNILPLRRNEKVAIRVVHDTVGTLHPITRGTQRLLAEQLQVTRTVVVIVQVLHAVVLTILRVIQGSLGRGMRHNVAHLLNPDTGRRVLRRSHIISRHGKSTAKRYSQ